MDSKHKLLTVELGPERVKFEEKLIYHTYNKIGGPAEIFYIATNKKELVNVLNLAKELKIPFSILGSGTKYLISDKGIRGLIIKNRTSAIKIGGIKGKVGKDGLGVEEALVDVDSGVSIGKLNDYLKGQGLKVLEGISSPASSLGGSIFLDPNLQNLCQKVEVWQNGQINEVDVLDLKRGKDIVLSCVLSVKAQDV